MKTKSKKPQPLCESQHLGYIRDNGDGTATYSHKKLLPIFEGGAVTGNVAAADELMAIFGLRRVKKFTKR